MTIKIKPLAWKIEPNNGWRQGVCYSDNGYRIYRVSENAWSYSYIRYTHTDHSVALRVAQDSAQFDHETFILSNIE